MWCVLPTPFICAATASNLVDFLRKRWTQPKIHQKLEVTTKNPQKKNVTWSHKQKFDSPVLNDECERWWKKRHVEPRPIPNMPHLQLPSVVFLALVRRSGRSITWALTQPYPWHDARLVPTPTFATAFFSRSCSKTLPAKLCLPISRGFKGWMSGYQRLSRRLFAAESSSASFTKKDKKI